MRTVIGSILVAVALFAAAAACLAEARQTRRLADVRERLLTLNYDDRDDVSDETLWRPVLPSAGDVERDRAIASYWQMRYDELVAAFSPRVNTTDSRAAVDPALMFVAANAAFRATRPETVDRRTAVVRLDGVIDAYADVLREDPANVDAAFNYEYVGRLRNSVARFGVKPPEQSIEDLPSVDLPSGPTLHGRPGGPPGSAAEQFKIITPMSSQERDETKPGAGGVPRRKG